MKIWAEHQLKTVSDNNIIKCPMCREEFGPITLLQSEYHNSYSQINQSRKNEHLGTVCRNCQVYPIVGNCYRYAI